MAIHLRPVLLGSMLLLMSAACRRAERPDVIDTTAPPQDTTTSQSAPAPAPTQYPGVSEPGPQEQQSPERVHVTGRDIDPSSIQRVPPEQQNPEAIHVTGRDDELTGTDEDMQLGSGGAGGSGGMGGSGGSHH
jgi:hypothetical protein